MLFVPAVTASAVLNSVGLVVNLFIAVVNYKTWLQSRRMSSSDRILFSLGVTRFLMLGLFLLYIMYLFIAPNPERLVHVSILFLWCWTFLDSSGLWFVTLLNVLYCVKIANSQHPVFLLLKRHLPPKIPRLLLACVLISAFTTFLYVVLPSPEFVTGRNGTQPTVSEDTVSLVISLCSRSFLQFVVNVTSASLLINSLRRHMGKMRRNAGSLWNPQTEAHVGAIKLMACFLLLYIPYSVAVLLQHLPSVRMDLRTRSICMMISTVYLPAHSVLIVLTHPKLKSRAKRLLRFRN
ncbi:PREDICTED: taste receptor type 2 member 4 [Miniopterus natalensis]|uniref:taste receptor type 2 member 4 n=1 Tax=Miniopterus natalensis TaxID=291302 RepID=UPI0007A6F256|nr:PREDICTED: taste receptor type 2 member 4 [Miniopterus natalensis]